MRTASPLGSLTDGTRVNVARLTRSARISDRWIFLAMAALAVVLTPLMGYLQLRLGFAMAMGLLIIVLLTTIVVVWPVAGMYTLAICAVVIEQDPLSYSIFTDHLYVFYWPANLTGLPERPIGFLALLMLLFLIGRRLSLRMGAPLLVGPIFWPFMALLGCVAIGVIYGLTSGGDPKIVVLEIRPFWYLFVSYLLTYNLVTHKRHAMAVLWITVVGTFFKALQGTYIVFALLGGHLTGQNEIMAHEQSFFFVLVILLIVLCLILNRMRLLMWIALISVPFLIIALIANNRRADYVALLIGLAGVWLFAIVVQPKKRAGLIWAAIICSALFGCYVVAFQHAGGSLGQAANAVVSVINPSSADIRDQSSNAYRAFEDFDLKFTEKQSPIIGYGFGKPFLQPDVLPNISGLDPYYNYIPHNTLLWVWMRLGPPGYIALWYLIGSFIIQAGIIARKLRDHDLRLLAIFGIGAILMEIPLAYGDYQLFFYRNIFFMGILMGVILRLPALDTPAPVEPEKKSEPAQEEPTTPRARIRESVTIPEAMIPEWSRAVTASATRTLKLVRAPILTAAQAYRVTPGLFGASRRLDSWSSSRAWFRQHRTLAGRWLTKCTPTWASRLHWRMPRYGGTGATGLRPADAQKA